MIDLDNDGFIYVFQKNDDDNHDASGNKLSRQPKPNGYQVNMYKNLLSPPRVSTKAEDYDNEAPTQQQQEKNDDNVNNSENVDGELGFYKIGAQWLVYDSHPGNDSSNQALRRVTKITMNLVYIFY